MRPTKLRTITGWRIDSFPGPSHRQSRPEWLHRPEVGYCVRDGISIMLIT